MRRRFVFLAMIFLVPILGGCQGQSGLAELEEHKALAEAAEQNKRVVLKWYEEIDQGNFDAAIELFHEDFHWYSPSNNPEPLTRDSAQEFMREIFSAFPKWEHRIDDLLALEDKVIARTVDFTKHEQEWQGIPASGNEVAFSVIVIFRLKDGKVIEMWEDADMLGFMSQLGMELKPSE